MSLIPWKSNNSFKDPFESSLCDFQKELDRLFHSPHRFSGNQHSFEALWTPNIDVHEDKESIRVKADLPGLTREQIEVTAKDNVLTIKGEKKDEKESKDKFCIRSERYYGQFHRSLTLPSGVDAQKVSASYSDGVLEVIIPKKEEDLKNKVKIEVK